METTKKTREQKMIDFYKTLSCENIDLPYFADDSHESFNDFRDAIEEGSGFDVEIIYYSRAIEYLANNDASLKESLSLASDMGFDLNSLSSETLASLLASQNARQDFDNLESEIEQFFEELNEERDNEENEEEEESEETQN